jgi:hypothetical protein
MTGGIPGLRSCKLTGSRSAVGRHFSVGVRDAPRLVFSPTVKSASGRRSDCSSFWRESRPDGHLPSPPSERGAWLLALVLCALGVGVLVAVLTGAVGRTVRTAAVPLPPTVIVAQVADVPAVAPRRLAREATTATEGDAALRNYPAGGRAERPVKRAPHAAIIARPSAQAVEERGVDATETHISRTWMEGFYPIYATAQSTFGVNWLLLASIHRQESAFSTAPGIYHGLNFAGCCGGPMQFNVTNGPVTTWDLVADSYEYGKRPAHYDHMTATHPSIYDDFDAIMAAAHLLSADGAEYALNESAWDAAYDYYGHDATGVTYADQVLARAIGWSQHGFCINCGLEPAMVEAVQAAYGAPLDPRIPEASTAISGVRTAERLRPRPQIRATPLKRVEARARQTRDQI